MYQCYYSLKLKIPFSFWWGVKNKCKNNNLDDTFHARIFRIFPTFLSWTESIFFASNMNSKCGSSNFKCNLMQGTYIYMWFDINMRWYVFMGAIRDRHKYMNRLHAFCIFRECFLHLLVYLYAFFIYYILYIGTCA